MLLLSSSKHVDEYINTNYIVQKWSDSTRDHMFVNASTKLIAEGKCIFVNSVDDIPWEM